MRDTVWFVQDKHNVAEAGFALLTLILSFYLFFLAYHTLIGISIVSPAWPLMALCYWRKHWPALANFVVFWIVGIFLDLCSSSVIGGYALAFLIAYCVVTVIQRAGVITKQTKKTKNIYVEALFMLVVIFISQLVYLIVQWSVDELHFSPLYFTQTLVSALLWPCFVVLLQFFHRFFKNGGINA